MRDYSLNERERQNFIMNVNQHDNDTYSIVFADGSVFHDVAVCDENFEKLTEIQEEQAKQGINHIDYFRKRATKSGVMTAVVGTLLTAGSVGVYSLPVMQSQDPVVLATSLGMITILGVIPAFVKLKEDCDIVKELEKLQYRDHHRDLLSSYQDYPNSLSGISREKKKMMGYFEDPFHIMNMDSFTEEELNTIVSNIRKEKALQFVYHK